MRRLIALLAIGAASAVCVAQGVSPRRGGSSTGSGITLTTTGTSGASTLTGTVLNIPVYSSGGSGITALTGDVTASGTGSVAATVKGISGVLLSGIATGPLCNTTTTGVPSACTLASFTALGLAPLASPTFTGTPAAPTATAGSNSTQIATTAYTDRAAQGLGTLNAGDTLCAKAADITIGAKSITGGSCNGTSCVVNISPVGNRFHIGQLVVVANATSTGGSMNITSAPITATTGTNSTAGTVTYTSAAAAATWTSGGTIGLACSNQVTDAITTYTNFATTSSIPANSLTTGKHLRFLIQGTSYTSSGTAAPISTQWSYGASTPVFTAAATTTPGAGVTGGTDYFPFDLTMLSTTLMEANQGPSIISSSALNQNNILSNPVPVVTTSAQNMLFGIAYTPTAVNSGTYTSGITATGTTGQTCTLTAFNNSSTATATVALTGTNTIAASTPLVITLPGVAATAAPTSATAGSGTATCTGTATIATVLGGAAGNAIVVDDMVAP